MKYLNSDSAFKFMMKNQVDTARANISLATLSLFPIPFPPIIEQQVIVTKVDELIGLCDILSDENKLAN